VDTTSSDVQFVLCTLNTLLTQIASGEKELEEPKLRVIVL
jgi:hypothetical protein